MECSGSWETEWKEKSEQALKSGWIPSQAWINSVQSGPIPDAPLLPTGLPEVRYGWWESFLHHHPNVFDRLAKAGRSLYHSKATWNAAKVP
jgi:hypothetical protein